MKKTFALLLAAALSLSLLTACGGQRSAPEESPSDGGAQATDTQTEGQYINTFITSDPSTLDCARFLSLIDRVILHSITEPLTRIQGGIVTAAGRRVGT